MILSAEYSYESTISINSRVTLIQPFFDQCSNFILPENTRNLWFACVFRGYKVEHWLENWLTQRCLIHASESLSIV